MSRPTPPGIAAAAALRWSLCLAALLAPAALYAGADSGVAPDRPGLNAQAVLAASRSAVGRIPGDYVLRDRREREVRLADYRGKPLLVNFIYTGCFQICPNSTLALRNAVNAMRERFGSGQFRVVSIGFDQPTDTPAALRSYAAQRRIADANWEFLSPRGEDVAALAHDFGFSYVATAGGFDHTLQVSIVDAEGRIRQQVVGDAFSAESLGEPLRQLIAGRMLSDSSSLGDLLDRVRILCSVYDPVTGKYRVSYALYIEIAGGLTFIVAMLWFAIREWRVARSARRLAARGSPP
ncbi:MAG: SCO family protein [Gammaproteobacteria bacterium]|nr:SCO family protein [Gammaproteobacteria bacterium]